MSGPGIVAAGVALLLGGCGYRAVYGGEAEERYAVVLGECSVAEALVCDEVAAGVREQLAREGALASGSAHPRVVVEVLRADEASEAWVGPPAGAAATAPPRSRALAFGVLARGWLERSAGGPAERDTGDLRAFSAVSAAQGGEVLADAPAALLQAEDARRAAARRLGHRIALRLLGFPVAEDESAGVAR